MSEIVNQLVDIATLIPHPRNYRNHPDTQVSQLGMSHARFGQFRSVVIWQRPNHQYMIVGGHGVVEAMKRNKVTQVRADVLPENTPQAEIDAILVADNLHALNAVDDDTMLATLLQEQQNAGYDLSSLGSDDETLRQMLESLGDSYLGGSGEQEDGAGGDEFDTTPQEDGPTRTHVGELWQMGKHRLLVGDSTKREDVERLMQGEKAAICFTSPPYNAGTSAKLSGNTHITSSMYVIGDEDALTQDNYLDLLCKFTDIALSRCEYAFVNIQMLAGNKIAFIDYLSRYKTHIADMVIWDKQQAAPAAAERVMNSQFEFVVVLSPQEMANRAIGTSQFRGTVRNVYSGMAQRNNEFSEIHAATFPLHFPSWVVETFTRDNDIVLDAFGGTGTTLIACQRLGRQCRMMELEPKYADVILKRYEAETGQTAQLLDRVQEVAHV
jgi:DNA modification methylase